MTDIILGLTDISAVVSWVEPGYLQHSVIYRVISEKGQTTVRETDQHKTVAMFPAGNLTSRERTAGQGTCCKANLGEKAGTGSSDFQ